MGNKIKVYLLCGLLSITGLLSCEKKKSYEFQPLLNVICILRNDVTFPPALIDRTYMIDEPEVYDLENVLAYISGPGVADTLINYGTKYFYSTSSVITQPESTYYIFVQAQGFEPVIGQTKIPARFQIIFPEPGDTIDLDDTLKFTKSKNAPLYYVWCRNDSMGYSAYWGYLSEMSNDTIMRISMSQFTDYIMVCGNYGFQVYAVDSNYFKYEIHWSDDYPCYGIENGIGFFGSIWAEEIMVYIEVED